VGVTNSPDPSGPGLTRWPSRSLGGLHGAVSRPKQAASHFLHAELRQAPDGADNIKNCVDGPDFVQVHLFRRLAMDFAFGDGDGPERGVGLFANMFWRARCGDEGANLVDVTPMRLRWDPEVHLPAD
jgi:hypothetical protein